MKKHETTEKVIIEALRLHEGGMRVEEIYAQFPHDREELRGIFSTIDFLSANRETVAGDRELLAQAIRKDAVTNTPEERYYENGGVPGRTSMYGHNTESLLSIMNKWKVIIPVGAVVLLLIVFVSVNRNTTDLSLSLREESDGLNIGTLDGAMDIESVTNVVDAEIDAMVGESAKSSAGKTNSVNFAELEKEMNQEAKTVEFGNDFESFFAEEEAMGEVDNAPTS